MATPYLRLRQICLVAWRLQPVVDGLCHVFGLQVCYRDPGVAKYGLENALMRVGNQFVEVVAPLPGSMEGTAATRHLQRRGGDCGYMVILDCDDITPWRTHLQTVGVREASYHEAPGYQGLQLHPADTGGALLEINHSPAGEDPQGAYWPAGPHWQQAPDSLGACGISGVTLYAAEPGQLAARWAQILNLPLAGDGGIRLSPAAALRTGKPKPNRPLGLSQIEIQVRNVKAVLASAVLRNCPVEPDVPAIQAGGVWWKLLTLPAAN